MHLSAAHLTFETSFSSCEFSEQEVPYERKNSRTSRLDANPKRRFTRAPRHGNGRRAEVTSCAPRGELPVLTHGSLMFYSRDNHRSPGLQLSGPTGSALVSASSHIHEQLTGGGPGSLRCTATASPGGIMAKCLHPRTIHIFKWSCRATR